jgi:PIN domain nuclease of toxin-antitoxin system
MNKQYILDACAILALLKNEEGADIVDSILVDAFNKTNTVHMHKLNLLEVYYGFYREDGELFAEQQIEAIKNSSISIIDSISDDVFEQAGRLKANYRISLADAIALAHSIAGNAVLISSDHHEFDIIENKEKIEILWIR